MTFRSDLDALRARHDALEGEVAARQKDLVETQRMIEEVERRVRLPVLDNIRVAAPCTADWNKMEGDERVRACGDCNKNVYNLSGMTREEAEALIIEMEGELCVRYYQRADGTILFGDCTIGVSRRRRRKLVAGAAALLAATGAVAYGVRAHSVQVLGGISARPSEEPRVVMGGLGADMMRGMPGMPAVPEWPAAPAAPAVPAAHVELGEAADPPAPRPQRAE
jgi:hypothetical protein